MRRTLLPQIALAVTLAAGSGTAAATPINFSVSAGPITTHGVSLFSTVSVESLISDAGESFVLDPDGTPASRSHTFSFFKVLITGPGLGFGTIDAALNFSDPLNVGTDGRFGGFFGLTLVGGGGLLTVLDDPDPISFDGGLFDVDFHGTWDVCKYNCTSLEGIVKATVSVLDGPRTGVPEPGTLALLGTGLLAFGISRRFRPGQSNRPSKN